MTDSDSWLANKSPASLLYRAGQLGVLKPRKALLFACGCYRLVWGRIRLPSVRAAVAAAEEKADRKLSQEELAKHRYPRGNPARGSVNEHLQRSISSLITPKVIPTHVAWLVRVALDPDKYQHTNKWEDCEPQADLVREILGNPYRPVKFDRGWRTQTALALARQIYDERDFAALPILADALQDAGCEDEAILGHCRDATRIHVRGCWVLDGLLGHAVLGGRAAP